MNNAISFILGAGFSAPFNIPTMRPFLLSFKTFAVRKYPKLEDTMSSHLKKLTDDSDIEGLLSSLNKAEELPSAMPSQCHMNDSLQRWTSESRSLKAHLISYIIERCEQFDREQAEECILPWLKRLDSSNILSHAHLFTTNYDRVLEHVSEVANVVLNDGFETSTEDLVGPWIGQFSSKLRLYKLHGSVTYYVDRQTDPEKEFLRLDRGYPLPGPDFRLSRQGRALEPLMVLPTLEKEAMDDPYGHLMHLFRETLAKGGLVIAMGTSLRDAHLVSALNYSCENIVVLVIDSDPNFPIGQIPKVKTVGLKIDLYEFLKTQYDSLIELVEHCAKVSELEDIFILAKQYAETQTKIVAGRQGITKEEEQLIDTLSRVNDVATKLEAIHLLHGRSHPEIVRALTSCLETDQSSAIRKAVVGCLGLGGSAEAVEILGHVASQDDATDVRLEAYLALREIGGKDAIKALETAKENWPEDPFFWEEKTREED